jgi:uncharacterized membrane protein YjjB (DUF3815 family)
VVKNGLTLRAFLTSVNGRRFAHILLAGGSSLAVAGVFVLAPGGGGMESTGDDLNNALGCALTGLGAFTRGVVLVAPLVITGAFRPVAAALSQSGHER